MTLLALPLALLALGFLAVRYGANSTPVERGHHRNWL
jgi:hypothetical protein